METTALAFDLVFALSEDGVDEAAVLDALFGAGCDDAVAGLGRSGLVGLSFSRDGAEADTVIRRAVAEALAALPEGASLREVRPGLA